MDTPYVCTVIDTSSPGFQRVALGEFSAEVHATPSNQNKILRVAAFAPSRFAGVLEPEEQALFVQQPGDGLQVALLVLNAQRALRIGSRIG